VAFVKLAGRVASISAGCCLPRCAVARFYMSCLDFRMKTTLDIDDDLLAELKRDAARQGRTMSEVVEIAVRLFLRAELQREGLPPLPTFQSGGTLVDDALYQSMGGR
jgi:ribbon-helix-helix CopG family protein